MFVTVNELVGLPGLPGTAQGVRYALNKCAAGLPEMMRRREGTKAFEYHIDCLPDAAREAVQARIARELQVESGAGLPAVAETGCAVAKGSAETCVDLELYRKCPALLEQKLRSLTDDQKAIADARMTLVCGVLKLMDAGGMSRKAAVDLIATGTQQGTISPEMLKAADIANARKGSTRKGVGKSSLQHWLSDYLASLTPGEKLAIMAPGKIKAKAVESYPWMPQFLQHWRDPNQPSVTMAYEAFVREWSELYAGNELMMAQLPSVDTVRYALKKIPKAERMRGRVTGSAMQSLLPFVRRDWSQLPVNGVWIGDGHGMKLEVLHPETGKPFKPEITLVIDGRTRVVMGWSLAMSESHIAVGDAIRNAISNYGVPLIYYSDNGGGEKNRLFDADITGIFSRLGITHPTGIPGNPQGRGIIERINREIPMRVAKKFGSYVGRHGDEETQRKYRKAVDSAVNAMEKGKPLNGVQAAAMRKVPAWSELIAEIEFQIERHNNRPHSELPKRENGEHWSPLAYRAHALEQEPHQINYLTSSELHEMFRPEVERVAIRGEIQLFNNRYFSTELANVEGEKVRVCFDIHDPNSVIIRRMDGSWVCDAVWDGNKVAAFGQSYFDQAKEKSVKRSVKNLENQIQRKKELLRPAIEHQPDIDFNLFSAKQINQEPEKIYLFESEFENDLKKASNH
jgi:putative transposase